MYIVMLGAPGSGKGTIGKRLSKDMNLVHISTGDIFREHMSKKTELGQKIEVYMSSGKLVPDNMAIEIAQERLLKGDIKEGVVLDGFPRTVPQAEALKKFLEENNKNEEVIAIQLNVPDNEIIDRIVNRLVCSNKHCKAIYNLDTRPPKTENICDICGSHLQRRSDDNLETIKKRLSIYHQNSKDIMGFYKKSNELYSIHPKELDKTVSEIEEYLKSKRK